ncbi:translocase of outer membrane 70 [Lycorma delicatula]|uniref:translocase of outer membrane 70 n=1 Tax=Lycorma delicatula TaxID=130591 RepID=UPI003F5171C2
MAGLNNVEIDKSSWLKWQIAVAVGAPVAIGVGYWYLARKSKKSDPEVKASKESLNFKDSSTSTLACNSTSSSPLTEINSEKNEKESVEVPAKEETPLESALGLKNSGNTFFKKKNYEDAIRCYTEAIEICPENEKSNLATFYQNRAAAYEHMQNFEAVIKDCSGALEQDPKYVKALLRRAKAYEQKSELTHCLEDISAVCILEGFKNERSIVMADRILQQIGQKRAKEAIANRRTVLLSKHFVKSYFISFNNDPVIKNFQNEINGHNETQDELKGIEKAKKCLLRGDFEDVIPACNEDLEKDQNSWAALLLRATMYFLVGEQKLALADFDKVIDKCPDTNIKTNALIKRASLYLQLETPEISAAEKFNTPLKNELFTAEKCMKDFLAAEKVDPNNSDIYHHRGQVNLLMDKIDLALEDFQKALDKKPDAPVVKVQMYYAHYRLASAKRDMETIARIIEDFKDLMKKHPECVEAYTLYIQICTDQRDYDQADEYFKKAIKADPNNATIRVQRATLYLQWKADVPKAIELIEEAIKIDDRCEYGYETLGTIEVQRGNLSRAIQLFEKALLYAKSELELAHIYSLRDAAKAQAVVAERLGLPSIFKPS